MNGELERELVTACSYRKSGKLYIIRVYGGIFLRGVKREIAQREWKIKSEAQSEQTFVWNTLGIALPRCATFLVWAISAAMDSLQLSAFSILLD